MSEFEDFCDLLFELDSREKGRLIAWQNHISRFLDLMAQISWEGLAGALSNLASELPKTFEALTAIGADSLAVELAEYLEDIKAGGFGDEEGFDLAAVYKDKMLDGEGRRLGTMIEKQETALWAKAEAFARRHSEKLELLGRNGQPFQPLHR